MLTLIQKTRGIVLLPLLILFIFPSHFLKSQSGDAGIPFWSVDAGTPAQRFELAKRSTPELIAFIRRMPKGADLHVHPGGSSYIEFILDQVEKNGLNYNTKAYQFTQEEVNPPHIITVTELKRNPDYLKQYLNRASMRGWYPNTTNGHDHFFSSFQYAVSGKYFLVERMVEIILRNRYENLQYLELMAPCVPPEVRNIFEEALPEFKIQDLNSAFNHLKPLLNDNKINATLTDWLDQWDKGVMQQLGQNYPVTGNTGALVIRYVPSLNRLDDLRHFFISAVTSLHAITNDPRVVGLNMVAPEDSPLARENFETQMTILDFLWEKMGKPNISLHAGELVLKESPVEPMRNRIRFSIEKGHAHRIGHGVSIAWEDNVVELLQKMHQEGILVEICLSSNEAILGIKDNDHPFNLYRRAGVPMSINTDDEGINRSNLTMEFVKAIQRYNLNYEEVKTLVRHSIEYSFLPGLSLFLHGDYQQLQQEFAGVRLREWRPGPHAQEKMNKNPKLNRQVILERALVEFEIYLMDGFGSKKNEDLNIKK